MKILKCSQVFILILISTIAFAQVRVGDFDFAMYGFKKLNKKTVTKFKAKPTKFILPDFYMKSEYDKILKEVWDVTPYEIILISEFNEDEVQEDDVLAHFLSGFARGTNSDGFDLQKYFCVLRFSVIEEIKNKNKDYLLKWKSSEIAAVYFTQSPSNRFVPPIEGLAKNEYFPPVEDIEYLSNFRLGYLKNNLELINNHIKNLESIDIYDSFALEDLKNLKDKILYIDNNFDNGAFKEMPYKQDKWPKIEDLMKEYDYKYEFVDYKKIEDMIMNNDSPDFYYLMYNQLLTNKILTVINGKNGNIIYENHSLRSLNLDKKDIKKLNSAINKQ